MNKVAFMSMDVESYFDTSCLKNKKIDRSSKYNCAEEILNYVNFLNKYNIKGTFFVVADFIKEAKPYLLEAIKSGHEIAVHALHHQSYKKMSKEDFKKEISEAVELIKKELGVTPVGFRFPRFEYRKELFDVLKELGFIYDSSVIKAHKKKYQKIRDFIFYKDGLYEFSPNHLNTPFKTVLVSGGGFYRFLRGKQIISLLKKHVKKHDTFMVYFHPFEIHKGYLPVPWNIFWVQKRYLKHNRDIYLDSLDKIVNYLIDNGYEFSNMKEYALKLQNDK